MDEPVSLLALERISYPEFSNCSKEAGCSEKRVGTACGVVFGANWLVPLLIMFCAEAGCDSVIKPERAASGRLYVNFTISSFTDRISPQVVGERFLQPVALLPA